MKELYGFVLKTSYVWSSMKQNKNLSNIIYIICDLQYKVNLSLCSQIKNLTHTQGVFFCVDGFEGECEDGFEWINMCFLSGFKG